MATLTEKETKVTHGNIEGLILAEYQDGKTDRIQVELLVNGHGVTWSLGHHHGAIPIYDGVKEQFTNDWKTMVDFVNPEFMLKLRKEMDKLITR